jgi:leucyl-tRNA synthetase
MRAQLRSMGAMFDWEREAVSCDPEYYHWSEWFFIQLYKHGMAHRKMSPVDWCPNCNTTLAREQVWGEDRHCERCGTPVIKKDLEQWFFSTTKYADELLDFSHIDWPERVRTLQTNWIGRSEGASVNFRTEVGGHDIDIFTTRPDTLWGATFMVFSPEHPLVDEITSPEHKTEVEAYKAEAARQTDIEREAVDKEKTGVFTGGYAINPVNDERIPIWIADYVLMTYGTGAIMAVPAHDERDFEFARKFELPIIPVIQAEGEPDFDGDTMEVAYIGPGEMINSGPFNGTKVTDDKGRANPGISAVIDWLEEKDIGREDINYRLRDWLISRQRYWGAPIPMIHCAEHGWNPVPEDQLPVLLPDDVEWKPTGESPLKLHPTWKEAPCPVCGEPATRETDTMDTFMCSSWYHLRYLSPDYHKGPFDEAEYNYWMPVDIYTGGIEHATMHLIYTRFFHKALRDMGVTEGPEPMTQLRNQGMVLGEDSEKMSKSRGNVIAPDELVKSYGADTVRAYLMFFARWDMGGPWNSRGIEGTVRWVRRTWTLFTDQDKPGAASEDVRRALRRKLHQTLKSVTHDFERFEFNTIISSLMELMNEMYRAREAGTVGSDEWAEAQDVYLRMLAPVCPHMAEELWTEHLKKPYSVHQQSWPQFDAEAAAEEEITIPVQVNGKLRDRVTVPADASDEDIKAAALATEGAQKHMGGAEPKKVIVAQKRLVNIVM